MDTVRPLPFTALSRPGMGDFLAALSSFAARKQNSKGTPQD
jgi:putative membrane protein